MTIVAVVPALVRCADFSQNYFSSADLTKVRISDVETPFAKYRPTGRSAIYRAFWMSQAAAKKGSVRLNSPCSAAAVGSGSAGCAASGIGDGIEMVFLWRAVDQEGEFLESSSPGPATRRPAVIPNSNASSSIARPPRNAARPHWPSGHRSRARRLRSKSRLHRGETSSI